MPERPNPHGLSLAASPPPQRGHQPSAAAASTRPRVNPDLNHAVAPLKPARSVRPLAIVIQPHGIPQRLQHCYAALVSRNPAHQRAGTSSFVPERDLSRPLTNAGETERSIIQASIGFDRSALALPRHDGRSRLHRHLCFAEGNGGVVVSLQDATNHLVLLVERGFFSQCGFAIILKS
jgi:hypothetical protein